MQKLFFIPLFLFIITSCEAPKDNIKEALTSFPHKPASDEKLRAVEESLTALIPMKHPNKWNIIDRMKHYNIPGVSFAIIQDFKLQQIQSYGFASVAGKEVLTEKTLFAAGSLSKFFTALACSKLSQEGRIGLDYPISKLVGQWQGLDNQPQADSITLRHLLSHTAGVNVDDFPGYLFREAQPSLIQVLAGTAPANNPAIRLGTAPLGEFQYSSGGYALIQQLLEEELQQDFEDMAKHQVFAPLQLTQSTFRQPVSSQFGKAATGYSEGSEIEVIYPELAAKGLWSTPTDIATVLIEIQKALKGRSKVYQKKQVQEILAPVAKNTMPGYQKYNPNFWFSDYGLGMATVRRKDEAKAQYFTHGGAARGFKTRIIGHVNKGYGAVIMVNSEQSDEFIEELLRSIALTYQWEDYLPYHHVEEKTTVSIFGYYNADRVSIAGSFNYWKANQLMLEKGEGKWSIQLPLPKGKYMYKIVVDDVWIFDPDNPLTEVYNNTENSLIEVK